MSKNIIIFGSNRGVGLGWVQHFGNFRFEPKFPFRNQAEYQVYATVRGDAKPHDNLRQFKNVTVIGHIDLGKDDWVENFREKIPSEIDLVVVNAGVLVKDTFENLDTNSMLDSYNINTLGSVRVVNALLPVFRQKINPTKLILTSSVIGSQTIYRDNLSSSPESNHSGLYGYRASRTSLNYLASLYGADLKQFRIIVAAVHPGYIDTDMASSFPEVHPMWGRKLKPSDAVEKILSNVVEKLNLENSGRFWHAEGYELPV